MSTNVRLDHLFDWSVAKSAGSKDYIPGSVPFVTSSELNNGVVAYVEPMEGDKVFEGPALCISGLGYATIQPGKFLPKGNGGDSLTIGMPRKDMTIGELVAVCAAFNVLHSWRFSFGRKCSKKRIAPLEIPAQLPDISHSWDVERDRAREIASRVDNWVELPVSAGATRMETTLSGDKEDEGDLPVDA